MAAWKFVNCKYFAIVQYFRNFRLLREKHIFHALQKKRVLFKILEFPSEDLLLSQAMLQMLQ